MKFRKIFPAIMAAAVLAISAGAWAEDECAVPVVTESGPVQGLTHPEGKACAWLGVPYAESPVGGLRWTAPKPHSGWNGIRPATAFGNRCLQRSTEGLYPVWKLTGMGEDCLYLNIYRPRNPGSYPVMVWIHGGGYVMGSGDGYRGDRLADAGQVVVVTINYRLDIFGYLAHPKLRAEDPNQSTGSYGSLDQVAALRWVHDNIANFGGDPKNVTVFGESAGGWAVCTMLATPLTHDLFHRAIMQSQGCSASVDLEKGYAQSRTVAEKVGCPPDDLACLRALPALTLVNQGMASWALEGFTWFPHHDGYLLTNTPLAMIRQNQYHHVPFMAGHTRDELSAILFLWPRLYHARPSEYGKLLKRNLKLSDPELEKLLALYPLSKYKGSPQEAYRRIFTDLGIGCQAYIGLAAVAEHQAEVYYYRFDYDEMKYGKYLRALHSMEIPFVFNMLDAKGWAPLYDRDRLPAAQELSQTMVAYWSNFARTGDPNRQGLAVWPRFDLNSQKFQILDTFVHTETSDQAARCQFWDQYLTTHPDLTQSRAKPDRRWP